MRLSIGSDHGGFDLRQALIPLLKKDGHNVLDHGTYTQDPADYPDYAELVAKDIINGNAQFGILICSTGIGISIAANKFPKIRAALVYNEDICEFSRKHNDANIICLGAKYHTPYYAHKLISTFIKTPYEAGRHQKRLDKIAQLDSSNLPPCC